MPTALMTHKLPGGGSIKSGGTRGGFWICDARNARLEWRGDYAAAQRRAEELRAAGRLSVGDVEAK